jgi:DNA-binding HxlR family transcriptional regulator
MGSQFGQFCPIALASEVLTQKWMLLVLRELNAGATRFNEIRRGVPRISATLLKQRLDQLEHAGIIERNSTANAGPHDYLLTEAGRELKEVLAAVGTWGQRWAREIEQDDLDAGWLVWAMHRRIDTDKMPQGRTVIEILFTDAPTNQRLFWLVCEHPQVDVCVKPPGYDVDVSVTTNVRCLAEVWRGIRSLEQSIASSELRVEAESDLQRAFPTWLMLSAFAATKRRRS